MRLILAPDPEAVTGSQLAGSMPRAIRRRIGGLEGQAIP